MRFVVSSALQKYILSRKIRIKVTYKKLTIYSLLNIRHEKWMLAAANIHYAKQSEAMGGDDDCHLHIGKTKKTPTRHTVAASVVAAGCGCPRQQMTYTLCTYIMVHIGSYT